MKKDAACNAPWQSVVPVRQSEIDAKTPGVSTHSELVSTNSVPPVTGSTIELLDALDAFEMFEMFDVASCSASRANRLKCELTIPSALKATSWPSRIRFRVDMLRGKRREPCRSEGALSRPCPDRPQGIMQGFSDALPAGSKFGWRV
eukprot:7385873-Prymnesium_polylepis.1